MSVLTPQGVQEQLLHSCTSALTTPLIPTPRFSADLTTGVRFLDAAANFSTASFIQGFGDMIRTSEGTVAGASYCPLIPHSARVQFEQQ